MFFEPVDKVFKKSIITSNQLRFPEDVSLGEDFIFNLKYLPHIHSAESTHKLLYIICGHTQSLSAQVDLKRLNDRDYMFKQLVKTASHIDNSSKYLKLACRLILQISANYAGKLYRAGFTPEEIQKGFSRYNWYEMSLNLNYLDIKSIIRKILLQTHNYGICAFLFSK